jgi:hypothetical protein
MTNGAAETQIHQVEPRPPGVPAAAPQLSIGFKPKRQTKCDALRDLLADGAWHRMDDLQRVAGWRYSARLHDLAKRGFAHDCERRADGSFWYRRTGR